MRVVLSRSSSLQLFQFDVVHQLLDPSTTSSTSILCAQHVLHLHVLLDSRDSSGSFLLWEPLLPWFLVFIVSHLTSSRTFNRFNVVTMCARSMFSFFVVHPSAVLYHNRFLDAENYSQCWSLWISLFCSKKRKKMLSSM